MKDKVKKLLAEAMGCTTSELDDAFVELVVCIVRAVS